MKILFCSDPFNVGQPDVEYEREVQAAVRQGLAYELLHFESLVNDRNVHAAVRRVRSAETPEILVYRGWMLRPAQYLSLYAALKDKGYLLINTPNNYTHCHYLPESYALIAPYTPRSVWLPLQGTLDMDRVMAALGPFGTAPVIVKDYVKSQKHLWHEACFIPNAQERSHVERVVQRFLDAQGDTLNEGLVFREYVPFAPLGQHPKSGMPLTKEYRQFYLDGERMYTLPYWTEATYQGEAVPDDRFAAVARTVRSRFFTMDIAQRTDGAWMIVELGDAQVAGLPDHAALDEFYGALQRRLSGGANLNGAP